MNCPICSSKRVRKWRTIQYFGFFECKHCESIFIDPSILKEIDDGRTLVDYSEKYWQTEIRESWQRSFGISLAKVAETILYSRRKIKRFLDIGSGPGFLLDAVCKYLPDSCDKFYSVEKFPPPKHTSNKNYFIGEVGSLRGSFDAGICMEVVEHLTPNMHRNLLKQLSDKSETDSLYFFNSGSPDYVKRNNPSYMDPSVRGHIVSYGLKGVETMAKDYGFAVLPIRGKLWAYCLEFRPSCRTWNITRRIKNPVPENKSLLHDNQMGNFMYVIGADTVNAFTGRNQTIGSRLLNKIGDKIFKI